MISKTSEQLRSAFLQFFAQRGHERVASGPLAPPNDPSLMFANAGMVQFKDLFTGREQRSYRRATTSQKCIRISGKHNDLESVGPSPRHHTFFEMLGNFSFGDYFKEDAIAFAWEFLVSELGIDPAQLMITYFQGDQEVSRDEQALAVWKKVSGFGEDRIIGLGRADNFWSMGETGPCGPCSEIYYYFGGTADPSSFGQELGPDGVGWMEIWNLVFMQFERDESGVYSPLPAPSIDTGMGLERLSTVIQGKTSNYDTDLLHKLTETTARLAGKDYGGSMSHDDVSMRVIADHARSTAFLLAEGIMPDRTGREYVLRRVMRRAIRHGHRLGISELFLHEVVREVVALMGEHYQELRSRQAHLLSVTQDEERRFRVTIERGLGLLEDNFERLEQSASRTLPGDEAFKLYDTYGFPLDLVEVICSERGFAVDAAGYEQALEAARSRSEFKADSHAVEAVYRQALASLGEPGSGAEVSKCVFTGYDRDEGEAPIKALLRGGELVLDANTGDEVSVVVGKTPFYAEAGGQVGDAGTIETPSGLVHVTDTLSPIEGLRVHRGRVERGQVRVGEAATLRVDGARRDATRRHHSATHLLHWALRQVLGEHAQQKGSLVGPEQLRFDFTSSRPLSTDELQRLEDLVNLAILENSPIKTEVLPIERARERGAMMIFEEKYGDTVRLLSLGNSRELCGGTHARATGDLGLFKIVSEQGIAAGVRRIVATTGMASLEHLRRLEAQLEAAARAAKTTPAALPEKIEKLFAGERKQAKQIEALQRQLIAGGSGGGIDQQLEQAREVRGVRVLGLRSQVTDRAALREFAETLRDKLSPGVVLVGSESEGKAQLVLTVSKELTDRFKAGELIRGLASLVGGSGGGRPDMAQAGGPEVSKLDEALAGIYDAVASAP